MAIDKRPVVKVNLEFPVTISGVEVQHLTMRRPKVRDEVAFTKHSGDDADKTLFLLASLCEVTIDDLLELDASDLGKLESQYAAFKGARPQSRS
jgi:hypothetical protein